jgi:hypothetical protein
VIKQLKASRKIAAKLLRILAAPCLARLAFRLQFFRRGLPGAVELDELRIDTRECAQCSGVAFDVRRATSFVFRLLYPHFDLLDLAVDREIEARGEALRERTPRALGSSLSELGLGAARTLNGRDLALPVRGLGMSR